MNYEGENTIIEMEHFLPNITTNRLGRRLLHKLLEVLNIQSHIDLKPWTEKQRCHKRFPLAVYTWGRHEKIRKKCPNLKKPNYYIQSYRL